jgi:hypothetical protein
MLKYELLPQNYYMNPNALPGICDLHPVLAIHKQEYVNDLTTF